MEIISNTTILKTLLGRLKIRIKIEIYLMALFIRRTRY